MKNHRFESSSRLEFCVVIGRACSWPFAWRVVNIAKRMSLIRLHSVVRAWIGSVIVEVLMRAPFAGCGKPERSLHQAPLSDAIRRDAWGV